METTIQSMQDGEQKDAQIADRLQATNKYFQENIPSLERWSGKNILRSIV